MSITYSQSLLKLMSIESVMPSSHLILCHPLLLLPPIPPNIRHQVPEVPSDEPKQKSLHEALRWGTGQNRNQAPHPTAVYLGFK